MERLQEDDTDQLEEKVSLKDAYTGKKYRYANLNALMIAFAQQCSGISFVI